MSEPMAIEKLLFTVDEVSKILSLPTTWLYERTRKNAIPCHRFGKYVRFTREDLHAIIASIGQVAHAQEN